MTRTLPANYVDILAGRHEADRISENLHAAFWVYGHDGDTALFLLNAAHREFAALAAKMGYTITPIEALIAAEVAA